MLRCLTCRGEYDEIQADGTQYFHACAPLNAREIRALLDRGELRLTARDQKRLDAAAAVDQQFASALPIGQKDDRPITAVDAVLTTIIVERPNKRDENVAGVERDGKTAIMRSAGAGVEKL